MRNQIKYILLIMFFYQYGNAQVGIGTETPKSMLDVNGNVSFRVMTLNGSNSGGSGTPVAIDEGYYISVNPIFNDDQFRLPNAVEFPGRMYIIRNINFSVTAKIITLGGLLYNKKGSTGLGEIYMYGSGSALPENGGANNRTITVISDGLNWTYFD